MQKKKEEKKRTTGTVGQAQVNKLNNKSPPNRATKMSIQGARLRRSGFQPVHQAKRDIVVLQRPTLSSHASRLGAERRTQGAARAEVGGFFLLDI